MTRQTWKFGNASRPFLQFWSQFKSNMKNFSTTSYYITVVGTVGILKACISTKQYYQPHLPFFHDCLAALVGCIGWLHWLLFPPLLGCLAVCILADFFYQLRPN